MSKFMLKCTGVRRAVYILFSSIGRGFFLGSFSGGRLLLRIFLRFVTKDSIIVRRVLLMVGRALLRSLTHSLHIPAMQCGDKYPGV